MSKYNEVAPGLFAFWSYDQFPYLLGGPITHMNEQGDVWTENYGRGYAFRPLKTLPVESGKALLAKLEELRAVKREAVRRLNEDFDAKLAKLLKENGAGDLTKDRRVVAG